MTRVVLLLALLALIVPVGAGAAFTVTTQNSGNSIGASVTFPTYPAAVVGDTPWAYWRGEDTTTAAADSSAAAHPGTYHAPVSGASTWWPADENTGTTVEDLAGAANRATLGAAAGWATGRDGVHSAMSFTGNAGTSYAAGSGPAVRTDRSFTAMAWAYLNSAGQARAVLSQAGVASSGFILKYQHTSLRWQVIMTRTDTNGPASDAATSTTVPALATWTHLAVVFTAGGALQLYVNGVLEGSTNAHTTLYDATGALQAGRSQWNGGWADAFDGRVDDVRTYRRALTAAEVAAAYGTGETTHWSLDENTGTTAADTGPAGNTGTLGAGASWTTGPTGHGSAVSLDGGATGIVSGAAGTVRTDTAFSFSAWAHPAVATAGSVVLSVPGSTGTAAMLRINAGGLWALTVSQTDAASPTVDEAAGTAAAAGAWVHLVGVYDGVSALRLYVDNTLAASGTHTTRWSGTGAPQVGRQRTGGATWGGAFSGGVDDVRIYARALNAPDVANLFAGTAVDVGPGTQPDPITVGLPGALQGAQQGQAASTATGFRGVTNLAANATVANPGPLTIECWFRTRAGGAIMGFGTSATGYSGTRDRMLYVDSGSRLSFVIYPGAYVTVRSPAGTTYADGAWHHVAASVGADGTRLYADGVLIASNAAQTAAQNTTGYWRVGGISLAGWSNRPANDYFTGVIDEPAVYAAQLSDQQIAWHYHANH